MRGQDEEEGGGRMSQPVAGRGCMWGGGGGRGSAHRYLGEGAGIGSWEAGGGEGGWVEACPRGLPIDFLGCRCHTPTKAGVPGVNT